MYILFNLKLKLEKNLTKLKGKTRVIYNHSAFPTQAQPQFIQTWGELFFLIFYPAQKTRELYLLLVLNVCIVFLSRGHLILSTESVDKPFKIIHLIKLEKAFNIYLKEKLSENSIKQIQKDTLKTLVNTAGEFAFIIKFYTRKSIFNNSVFTNDLLKNYNP